MDRRGFLKVAGVAASSVLAAAACGTKGALYLPPPEAADGAAAKPKR